MLHEGEKIPHKITLFFHFLILFCEMGVSCGFIFSTKASNFISTFNQSKRRQKFLTFQEFLVGRSSEACTDGIVIVSYRCQVCNYMILYFYRYEM